MNHPSPLITHRAIQQPTHARYIVLAVACSLAVLTYLQRQGFVAGTPFIKKDLGLNDEQMGYLASVWLVAYGIFQVPGGLLGDRLGARRLLTLLVLGWSASAGAVALTVNLPPGGWQVFAVLVTLRLLFGGFQGGGFPALARVIADWVPARQRGFAQGLVWTFSRLGGFVAPPLVVSLIGVFGGWAAPTWLLAGLGLAWCAAFYWWFRDRPEQMHGVNPAELALLVSDRPSAKTNPGPTPWARFPASVSVWGLCLMYGFVGFAGNFVTAMLPLYLRDHLHLSDRETGWVSGLPMAAGIVSCLLGGVLSDWLIRRTGSRKWGRRLVGGTAMILAGLACLSAPWVQGTWTAALCFSAWFFCNDLTMGPAWASCADVGERYAGTLSGAMNMAGAFVGAVGMAVAGRLLHRGQDQTMFLLFACSYALAALCWLAVDVTKPLVPKELELTPLPETGRAC